MKITTVVFIFIAYGIFQVLYFQGTSQSVDAAEFEVGTPTFDAPVIEFIDLSAGCGGFTDCIEYVGGVLYNLVAGVIFLVLFIIELILFIIEFTVFMVTVTFTGVNGAPWWINSMIIGFFSVTISIIIYKLFRKGESAA